VARIAKGDIVARRSYKMDIYFKVCELYVAGDGKEHALLRGIDVRLLADAPVDDLVKVTPADVAAHWRNVMEKSGEWIRRAFTRRQDTLPFLNRGGEIETFDVPGRVLHVDGDADYLELCETTYRQLGVPYHTYHLDEREQPNRIGDLLRNHQPDILVLTGHDGFLKGKKNFADLASYRNSKHFVAAVLAARRYEKSRDDLVIFAGACQSHYEALLDAGANFASSPQRVMIHAFDPVFIVEKIAYTPTYKPLPLKEIIEATITGFPGIGGVETWGKYRLGAPKSPY